MSGMFTTSTAASRATGTCSKASQRAAIREDSPITMFESVLYSSVVVIVISAHATAKESVQLNPTSVSASGMLTETSPVSHWTSSSAWAIRRLSGIGGSQAVSVRLSAIAIATTEPILRACMFLPT